MFAISCLMSLSHYAEMILFKDIGQYQIKSHQKLLKITPLVHFTEKVFAIFKCLIFENLTSKLYVPTDVNMCLFLAKALTASTLPCKGVMCVVCVYGTVCLLFHSLFQHFILLFNGYSSRYSCKATTSYE